MTRQTLNRDARQRTKNRYGLDKITTGGNPDTKAIKKFEELLERSRRDEFKHEHTIHITGAGLEIPNFNFQLRNYYAYEGG